MSNSAQLPPKGRLGSLRYLLHYLRPYRRHTAGAVVALVMTSSVVLGMGAALRYLIDEGIRKGDQNLLGQGYLILLGVVALLAMGTYSRYLLVSLVGERVVADIRRDVFAKVLSMHTAYFESSRTGDLIARITTDTTLLQTVIGSSISVFMRNALLFTGGFILLLVTSVKLSEYVLLMLPLVILPIITLGRRVRALSRATQNKVGDISAHAEETIGAIRTIHAMALEEAENQRFGTLINETVATALSRIRMRALLTAIVICLIFGAVVTVLYIGGQDVIAGRISPGDLSAFIFYSVVVAGALGALSEVVGEMQRAAGATERLMELMQLEPEIKAPAEPFHFSKPPEGRLSFEHVSFHYASRPDKAALSNVSFRIEPGETVAIVGPSGAGKTTIFQLLLRFYDPQFGIIRIDGHDVRTLAPRDWRGHIGLVPQDPVIFSTSAFENIRIGNPGATDDDVREAAKIAAALDFLEALPDGLHTYLGEKGVRLSGGQRQRVAIARAIIRNPSLLLLDEATSALDAENETAIQSALERIMKERTTLVIAHRLATVVTADRIIVLNDGKIEASGTHTQLLAGNPLYKRLAELQFSE
ncbi:MAG: ABC transporter transmembrane domain-containing protein [Alphaproteobacteria bacterium]|nr:ABC transporter transmembrane domain-containing protein [Alphaproteobacteria bacterium]